MWEIANGIRLDRPPGDVGVQTLEDLLDWIAAELAKGVLRRLGQGLYRAYVDIEDELSVLRGRLDLRAALARPWRVALPRHYQELNADVAGNPNVVAGPSAAAD